MSIIIFKIARWLSVISFIALLNIMVYLPSAQGLIMALVFIFIVSFVCIAIFKCNSCGNSYSTKLGFISIYWPYTGSCHNCGKALSDESK